MIGRADNKGKGTETEGFQNNVLEISKPITNLIFRMKSFRFNINKLCTNSSMPFTYLNQ